MHALVLLSASSTALDDEQLQARHEAFIDELDRQNRVILGGGWDPATDRYVGAYLLNCGSREEAQGIARADPFVRAGAARCEVVEWVLVGMNPDAVDRTALLYPNLHSPEPDSLRPDPHGDRA
jgi:uncharacterized protein YciI